MWLPISIIALTLFVSITNIIKTFAKWKETHWSEKLAGLLGIVLAFLVAWYSFDVYQNKINQDRITARIDALTTPKLGYSPILNIRGSQTSFLLLRDTSFLASSFGNIFKCVSLDGNLIIDATIRNEKGEDIGIISKNTWKIYSDKYDYNNDNSGFEVVTMDERVVFQIEYKSDTVLFAGALIDPAGTGWYVYPAIGGMYLIPVNKGMQGHNDPFIFPKKIKPMFKYPREKFYGIRN